MTYYYVLSNAKALDLVLKSKAFASCNTQGQGQAIFFFLLLPEQELQPLLYYPSCFECS